MRFAPEHDPTPRPAAHPSAAAAFMAQAVAECPPMPNPFDVMVDAYEHAAASMGPAPRFTRPAPRAEPVQARGWLARFLAHCSAVLGRKEG